MKNPIAAYLGPPGTFSHQAALTYFNSGDNLVPAGTAGDVIRMYREETVDQVILAIDTSIAGTVGENLDAIGRLDPVRIVGETIIAVHHQLMAPQTAQLGNIGTIIAHPKAFEECLPWLDTHLPDAIKIPVASSALAALKAGEDLSGRTAAIASQTAGDNYRLKILAADIESSPLNTTRFWILGRQCAPPTGCDRTTLQVTGSLNAALSRLVHANARILSVYDRPSGANIENRSYFIDVAGHCEKAPLSKIMSNFSEGRLLGSYPCCVPP